VIERPKLVAKVNDTYPALDMACHDIGVFIVVSAGVGLAIFATGAALAVTVDSLLAATIAFAYFPFATAFILSQHLVSLRMKKAEYLSAPAGRRQKIEVEVQQYQKMMLRGGLTAPVAGLVGLLRQAAPAAEAKG